MRQGGSICSAEAQQYMRQAERGRIYEEAESANLFAAVQALSIFECRRALVSPNGETSSNPFLYYKVPKGPRLKGVYTPFRGCRLSLRGLKMSFEERRARVFKSLLLIPSKCSQKREYLNSAKMRILTSNTLMSSVL